MRNTIKGDPMIKKIILILMFLICISFVNAYDYNGVSYGTTIFYDDFEYGAQFTYFNWSGVSEGADPGDYPTTPQTIGGVKAMGWFSTNYTGNENFASIFWKQNLDTISTGRFLIVDEVYVGSLFNTSTAKQLYALRSNSKDLIAVQWEYGNYSTIRIINALAGGQNCENEISITKDQYNTIILEFDIEQNTYSLYINDNSTECSIKTLGTIGGVDVITNVPISISGGLGNYVNFGHDSFGIYSTKSINESGVTGGYCAIDSDCQFTLNCVANKCICKNELQSCSANTECCSGVCSNGYCTAPTISKRLSNLVSDIFGTDSDSDLFLGIIIIVGLTILTLLLSKSILGAIIGLVLGIIVTAFGGFIPASLIIILVLVIAILSFIGFVISHKG